MPTRAARHRCLRAVYRQAEGPLTTDPVAASGNPVVFGPTADKACPAGGSYTWKVSGRTLSLTLVKEGCTPLRVLFTAGAWTRA